MSSPQQKLAYFLLIIVNLIYGENYSIAKQIMPSYIGPYGFIFYRVFISLILFFLIYLFFLREKIARKDWWRFLGCGLFGIALNQLLFFKGISLTSSVHGALLMITSPMFTYLLSQLLARKKVKLKKIGGIALGILGASILIVSSMKTSKDSSALGDMLVIINAISFSIYLILVKPLISRYHPLTITFYVFLTGSIWVAIFGYQEAVAIDFCQLPSSFYWNFSFVIVCATFLVYLFNNMAMRAASPTTVSSFIYLQPLFAILISISFTAEKMTLYTVFGGILIIFGLWLVNHSK
jgi:drug/metabolite transporter (DMT)-like permease